VSNLQRFYKSSIFPKIFAPANALIIDSRYNITVLAIFASYLFGTTANKVSSNVRGKNFCFQR